MSRRFVAGPDGSAKRRRTGSVQVAEAGTGSGEAQPQDRGQKFKIEDRVVRFGLGLGRVCGALSLRLWSVFFCFSCLALFAFGC